jgi:hypothetical protein
MLHSARVNMAHARASRQMAVLGQKIALHPARVRREKQGDVGDMHRSHREAP